MSIPDVPKAVENDKDEKTKVEYDELLASAGEFGRYQLWLIGCASPFYVFSAFVYFVQVFITEVSVNHWCWIPELKNLTVFERRTLAIPSDSESIVGYSRCSSYVANWSTVLTTGLKPNASWSTEKCQYGWEFDKSEIPYPTIGSEMGWVCDKDSYQATAQSFFFIGCIIGGFVVGFVSDKFGRVPATVVANILGCIGGLASTFTTSFWQFAVCRILVGMAYDNCVMMMYLLILEFTVPKYRSMVANMTFGIFFTIGVVALPWISLACGDWKVLSLATSTPLAIAFVAPYIVPESPRWLLSKGRVEEVIQNIYTIGKTNKKRISPKMVEQFRDHNLANINREAPGSMLDIFKRPSLRKMFICICLEYLCCMAVFDGLVRTIDSLKFDFFVSFTVISFTELPSLVLLSLIMDYTGRKWLSITVMTTCALFSFLTPFVGGGLSSVLCSVVARFCVNMGCNSILQWSAELMPTPIRGSATSIIHTTGYFATAIAPFIAYLDNYISGLSLIIIGGLAFFAATLCLYLPETANKELPQTLEDAEEFMRTKKLFDLPCLGKNKVNDEIDLGNVNSSFRLE